MPYIFEDLKNKENILNALDCFFDIINCGNNIFFYYMQSACKYFEKLPVKENILTKLIIIFIDLIQILNMDVINYLEIGCILMENLIVLCENNNSANFRNSLEYKKYIQINEILLLFIDDLIDNANNYQA